MSLSVKAYIYPDTDQQEIRRFAIDEGASANFSYLVQKIEQVFPAIRGKAMRLYWKDADKEMITFSSDEELVEALGSIGGDVFRVYVKEGENKETSSFAGENDQSEQAHPGVVCDGCDKDIFGVRFKCVVCPNFDLCFPCESKGLHKQHEMLRIARPRNSHDWFQGFNPFGPHFPPHQTPHFPPHHPPHFPPHHPPNGHPPHPSFGFPPFDHGQGFGPWGRGQGFAHRGGRGRCGKNKSRCGKEGQKCDRHSQTQTGEVPVGPPFLHAVGETIASFLGPFGVEVHTYASNEPDCCQGKCQETEQNSATEGPQAGPSGEIHPTTPQSNSMDDETSQMEIPREEFVVVSGDQGNEPADPQVSTDPLEVAIAQMRSMGFDDDSGWLSQLIVAKDYDIGKVLDAIQFSGKN